MFTSIKKWAYRLRDKIFLRRARFQSKLYHILHPDPVTTQVFAHRGSKSNRPENTLAAFKEAVRVGADGIELDVHLTKDGQIIVIHDETIDRTTNGKGQIRKLTLAQIQSYSAGSWFNRAYETEKVPLLSDVLALLVALNFTGVLNIELKTDKIQYVDIEKKTSDLLMSQDLPFSHIYCSFNLTSLARLATLEPQTELCYLMSTSDRKIQIGLETSYITHLNPRLDWLQKNSHHLKQLTKPLRPWTLNNDTDIYFAFNHQLAGFMTDYPERAIEIKKQYYKK